MGFKIIAALFVFGIMVAPLSFAADGEVSVGARDDGTFTSLVEVGHRFSSSLRPYASIGTGMDQWTGEGFHPDTVTYDVGLQYLWDPLTFSLSHVCVHPVDRDDRVYEYNGAKVTYRFGDK